MSETSIRLESLGVQINGTVDDLPVPVRTNILELFTNGTPLGIGASLSHQLETNDYKFIIIVVQTDANGYLSVEHSHDGIIYAGEEVYSHVKGNNTVITVKTAALFTKVTYNNLEVAQTSFNMIINGKTA